MTWSGNMKNREGRKGSRRPRYNSSGSSSRGTPSPRHCEDRTSPISPSGELALKMPGFSPIPRETYTSLSRSPSPQGNAYAGAKFSEPPSPESLPKPPTHWMNFGAVLEPVTCDNMSTQIKMLLKVAAC